MSTYTIALGSPGYAAPEQYGKAQTDPRSDIYSLGAMLHQMLSGNDPSETPFRFAPLDASTPSGLNMLIAQMVEINEDKRPASAAAVKQVLEFIADAQGAAQQTALPVAAQPPSSAPALPVHPALLASVGAAIVSGLTSVPLAAKPPAIIKKHTAYYHGGWVWDAAWSPDGNFIASASEDETVQVWEAETLNLSTAYRGHENEVFAVAWSPDGKRLASASADHTIQVWDAFTGKNSFPFLGHTNVVIDVAWSADGTHLVSCSGDKTVRVWGALTGRSMLPDFNYTRQVPAEVYAAAWSPDGKRIAFSSEDGKVYIWWPGTNADYSLIYRGHNQLVGAVAWSPDGKHIASASVDGTVRVWDSVTGYQSAIYTGHDGIVYTVAWSPDGRHIASGSLDKTVHVWTPANPGRLVCLYEEHAGAVRSVAWSPDGSHIASGSLDKTVHIWQPAY